MDNEIELICGLNKNNDILSEVGNNPDFVFINDSNYETITLFDVDGNIINVNSWIECAHYVNGGWSNTQVFLGGEKYIFFGVLTVFFIYVGIKYLNVKFSKK